MASTFQTQSAAKTNATLQAALKVPVGLSVAAPMLLAFGAAASAGVAWWWMTRWTRPLNLEAISAVGKTEVADAVTPPEPVARIDDLTCLVGIGPKLAAALAARGVTSFTQLAAWTDADLAQIDSELKLMGRPMRDNWTAQAARLAAGS